MDKACKHSLADRTRWHSWDYTPTLSHKRRSSTMPLTSDLSSFASLIGSAGFSCMSLSNAVSMPNG